MKPDNDVLTVALVFKREMAKRKMKYEWPKAKDVTKTYHYRWFKKFLNNCKNKHGLDMQESLLVLKSIVEFAGKNGLLRRGATLLQRSDQIDIFIRFANDEISKDCQMVEELQRCEDLFVNEDKMKILSKKERRGGYNNLVKMVMDGKLALQYVVLSKTCMKVYNSLSHDDKSTFPNIVEMSKLRNKIVRLIGPEKIKGIMKEDFNG